MELGSKNGPQSRPGLLPPRSANHVKRPLNGFMLWAKDQRREVKALPSSRQLSFSMSQLEVLEGATRLTSQYKRLHPNAHNAAVSKYLGERWNELPATTKAEFMARAKELKSEHLAANPGYKYCPRRRIPPPPRPPAALEVLRPMPPPLPPQAPFTLPGYIAPQAPFTLPGYMADFTRLMPPSLPLPLPPVAHHPPPACGPSERPSRPMRQTTVAPDIDEALARLLGGEEAGSWSLPLLSQADILEVMQGDLGPDGQDGAGWLGRPLGPEHTVGMDLLAGGNLSDSSSSAWSMCDEALSALPPYPAPDTH